MDEKKISEIKSHKQRKPLTKNEKIGWLILLLAPIGLVVMWLKSSWSIKTKLLVTILGILWTLFGVWFWTQGTKPSIAPPKIGVGNSVQRDGKFIVESSLTSVVITTGKPESNETTTLTANGKNVEPSKYNLTQFILDLKDRNATEYKLVAENANGKDEATILINFPMTRSPLDGVVESKPDPEPQPTANQAETDAIFEAEITCQQYAESYFGVKDINIHYDQSSIKRKNLDGSILIKVSISDSRGLLRADEPLGTMECKTNMNGSKVVNFVTYQ